MKLLVALIALALLFALSRWGVAYLGSEAALTGLSNGQLNNCPSTPNCVSSQGTDEGHQIEALNLGTDTTIADIAAVLRTLPRMTIVTEQDHYLHGVVKTRVMGFMDDLELLKSDEPGVFHVRSASRLGVSDLGVNRKRVEYLRSRLQ